MKKKKKKIKGINLYNDNYTYEEKKIIRITFRSKKLLISSFNYQIQYK